MKEAKGTRNAFWLNNGQRHTLEQVKLFWFNLERIRQIEAKALKTATT